MGLSWGMAPWLRKSPCDVYIIWFFLIFSLHSKVFESKVVVSKPHFMGGRCQVLLISWLYMKPAMKPHPRNWQPVLVIYGYPNLPRTRRFNLPLGHQLGCFTPTKLLEKNKQQLTKWAVANPTGPKLPELLGSRSSPGDWIRWVSIHLKSSQLSKKITQIFLNSFEVLQKQSEISDFPKHSDGYESKPWHHFG